MCGVGAPAYCAWSLYAVDAHSWVYMVDACGVICVWYPWLASVGAHNQYT